MFFDEYDYDLDIKVNREDAYELKAKSDTIKLYQRGYTVEDLYEFHDFAYSEEQILQWISEYKT